MGRETERSFGQELNSWVQTLGIIIAALWGIWTFWHKEIIQPQSAPVNVTTSLELKKVKPESKDIIREFITIEVKASAHNPTTREIYLLEDAWIAYGYKVEKHQESLDIKGMTADYTKSSNTRWRYESYSSMKGDRDTIAAGNLFIDDSLKPQEKISTSLLFYVPSGKYDYVSVEALFPSALSISENMGPQVKWSIEKYTGGLVPTIFKVNNDGTRKEMELDKYGFYVDKKIGLQMSSSNSLLSLD